MIPLLLLLLLPASLAELVTFEIKNREVHVNMTNTTIVDRGIDRVKCKLVGFDCCFLCPPNTMLFNGSSYALDATVTRQPALIVYSMTPDITCTLYKCENTSIMPMLEELSGESSGQRELQVLIYLRRSCIELFSKNRQVKETYIDVERYIIHNMMSKTELDAENSVKYDWDALSLRIMNISDEELLESVSTINIQAPQLLPENSTYVPNIWMPRSALQDIPQEKRILGVVSYRNCSAFQFEQEEIASMVLRIEPLGVRLRDLETKIKMTFRTLSYIQTNKTTWYECRFFDEFVYRWKTDGCETDNGTEHEITCMCDHATPFAVLLIRQPIAQVHWQILSSISYIGCGLSAFFTALSLVIYVFSRKHKLDFSIAIHVSLSGALFLLNIAFLLTEWGATAKEEWVCECVAAIMHYSLLCSFTWMAIEALHLYLLLIKVFNTYYKHYLLKLSLAGWGIPCVIVAVSLCMRDFKQFYGVTHMTMADTNQTNSICWITDDSFFYSLNLVYFTIIFVFNSGILVAVASSICKMKQVFKSSPQPATQAKGMAWGDPGRLSQSCKSGLTVLGLTCLMGTTWGLAFLGSGYVNYPILYLFCILNSTQGFFIFLWICLSAQKQRKRHMEDRMTSNPVKTITSKSS